MVGVILSAPQVIRLGSHDVLKIWRKKVNQLIIDGGVCRTAPATPGLLMKQKQLYLMSVLTHPRLPDQTDGGVPGKKNLSHLTGKKPAGREVLKEINQSISVIGLLLSNYSCQIDSSIICPSMWHVHQLLNILLRLDDFTANMAFGQTCFVVMRIIQLHKFALYFHVFFGQGIRPGYKLN